MIYIKKIRPDPILNHFIKYFIVNETDDFQLRQIVPSWTKKLITFQYKDPVQIQYTNKKETTCEINIHGNVLTPYEFLPMKGEIGIISVELTDYGFYHLVRGGIEEFNNNIISMADLFPQNELRYVADSLNSSGAMENKIRIVEDFMIKRFMNLKAEPIEDIRFAAGILENPQLDFTNLKISNIAEKVNLGGRHFRRKFKQVTGLSPKKYYELHRVNEALFLKMTHPETSWSDIAYRWNYADQSHMIREFKHYLNKSPNEINFTDMQMACLYR